MNNLFLNIEKCKIINFTRKIKDPFAYTYHFNGSVLNNVNDTLDLGVYVDKKLNFKIHVNYIINKANSV